MLSPINTKDIADRYIHYVGLEGLKRAGKNWFAKCPYCKQAGKKVKERKFYILTNENKGVNVYCHKCGTSKSFYNFLTDFSPSTLESIKLEVLLGKRAALPQPVIQPEKPKAKLTVLDQLIKVGQVKDAVEYCCDKRKFPPWVCDYFYYSDNYMQFLFKNKIIEATNGAEFDKRIIIPYYNDKHELTHLQGRAIYETKLRYMTNTLIEDAPKIWGLDRIDKSKTVYITEGAFDAIFISNCIAFGGALADINIMSQKGIKDFVFCFDHDIETNEKLKDAAAKYIEMQAGLFFFPKTIDRKYKDFNDLAMAGWTEEKINMLVKENTFRGLQAKVKLAMIGGKLVS